MCDCLFPDPQPGASLGYAEPFDLAEPHYLADAGRKFFKTGLHLAQCIPREKMSLRCREIRIFIELRIYAMPEIVKFLLAKGLTDWSQIAFTTDDRSASHQVIRFSGHSYIALKRPKRHRPGQ